MKHLVRSVLGLLVVLVSALALAQDGVSQAVLVLLEKAKAGDPVAQFRVANAYDSGRGVPRDGKEAMRWYTAAAEQGHAPAEFRLGCSMRKVPACGGTQIAGRCQGTYRPPNRSSPMSAIN